MDLKVIILTMLAANALPKPFEIPQHQENHGGGVQHEYAIAFIISVLASVFVFVVIEGWKKRSALKKIFRRIRRRFSKVKEIDYFSW